MSPVLLFDSFVAVIRNGIAFCTTMGFFNDSSLASQSIRVTYFGERLAMSISKLDLIRTSINVCSIVLFLQYGYANLFGSLNSILNLRTWKKWCAQQSKLGSEKSCVLLQCKILNLIKSKQYLAGTGIAQIIFAHTILMETVLLIDPRLCDEDMRFWLSLWKMTSVCIAMRGLWHLAVTELNSISVLLQAYSTVQKAVIAASDFTNSSFDRSSRDSLLFPSANKLTHTMFESTMMILEEDGHWMSSNSSCCLNGPYSSKAGHEELICLTGELCRLGVAVVEKGMGMGVSFDEEEKNLKTVVARMKRNTAFYLLLWTFNALSFAGLGVMLVAMLGPKEEMLRVLVPYAPTHSSMVGYGTASQHLGLALEGLALLLASLLTSRGRKRHNS